MKWPVAHVDRDIEFILKKRQVEEYVNLKWHRKDIGRLSCEDIALELIREFQGCCFVSVLEDGENGAEVYL